MTDSSSTVNLSVSPRALGRRGVHRRKTAGALASCLTLLLPLPLAAQAQTQPFQSTAAASISEGNYRINVGDELDVLVWGEERMQRTVRVQPDGTFSFPLAGTISAAGHRTREVSLEIQSRLAGKYRDGPPDVTVSVRDPSGMRFFVVGKVRSPGSYAGGGNIDIVQALSMAGGLADFADVKGAVILRKTPQGQMVERVKLARVLKGSRSLRTGALTEPLPVLRSGDVLVIP